MAVTSKVLIPATIAANAQTTYYTATGVTGIIDKFTARNYSVAAASLSVNIVTSGGSAGDSNLVVNKTLQPGETYTFPEVVGHVLASGGFISTIASAATSIAIRASGREIS